MTVAVHEAETTANAAAGQQQSAPPLPPDAPAERMTLKQLTRRLRLAESACDMFDQLVDMSDIANFGDPGENNRLVGGELTDLPTAYSRSLIYPGATAWAYINEIELRQIRARTRVFGQTNPYAIGAGRNRIAYTVGNGHTYKVTPRDPSVGGDTVEAALTVIENFRKRNKWNKRQKETVRRLDRDGERFLRLFIDDKKGELNVRFVEPLEIQNDPKATSHSGAYFGIQFAQVVADEPGTTAAVWDIETPTHYYLVNIGTLGEVISLREKVPADQMQHLKANVDMTWPRGLPTFWALMPNMNNAIQTLKATGKIVEFRARIGMIRRHINAAKESVTRFVEQQKNAKDRPTPTASKYPYAAIIDTSDATEYQFPAGTVPVDGNVAAIQAELRTCAAALAMPEYMLSGDASNANFSSTMVAEGPAVKTFEEMQGELIEADVEIMERQLAIAAKAGLITNSSGDPEAPDYVLNLVKVEAEPPIIKHEDALMEAQADQILNQAGVLSKSTFAARHGLEWADEKPLIEADQAEDLKRQAAQQALMPQPVAAAPATEENVTEENVTEQITTEDYIEPTARGWLVCRRNTAGRLLYSCHRATLPAAMQALQEYDENQPRHAAGTAEGGRFKRLDDNDPDDTDTPSENDAYRVAARAIAAGQALTANSTSAEITIAAQEHQAAARGWRLAGNETEAAKHDAAADALQSQADPVYATYSAITHGMKAAANTASDLITSGRQVIDSILNLWQADEHPLIVRALDIGHGGAVMIHLPNGKTMLFDAGKMGAPYTASATIREYLDWYDPLGSPKSKGILSPDMSVRIHVAGDGTVTKTSGHFINYVVLSHPDTDHYNALPDLVAPQPAMNPRWGISLPHNAASMIAFKGEPPISPSELEPLAEFEQFTGETITPEEYAAADAEAPQRYAPYEKLSDAEYAAQNPEGVYASVEKAAEQRAGQAEPEPAPSKAARINEIRRELNRIKERRDHTPPALSVGAVYVPPQMFKPRGMNEQTRYLYRTLSETKTPIRVISDGDTFDGGHGCTVKVLNPAKNPRNAASNARAIALEVNYQGRSMLLTSDLVAPGTDDVLARRPKHYDLITAPHHGSVDPIARADALARWATPSSTIVQADHRWNTDKTEAEYAKYGIVYHTQDVGNVKATITHGHTTVESYLPLLDAHQLKGKAQTSDQPAIVHRYTEDDYEPRDYHGRWTKDSRPAPYDYEGEVEQDEDRARHALFPATRSPRANPMSPAETNPRKPDPKNPWPMPPWDDSMAKLGRLKDPEKIKAKIAQDRAKYEAEVAEEANRHGVVHDTIKPLYEFKHTIARELNDLTGISSETPLDIPGAFRPDPTPTAPIEVSENDAKNNAVNEPGRPLTNADTHDDLNDPDADAPPEKPAYTAARRALNDAIDAAQAAEATFDNYSPTIDTIAAAKKAAAAYRAAAAAFRASARDQPAHAHTAAIAERTAMDYDAMAASSRTWIINNHWRGSGGAFGAEGKTETNPLAGEGHSH
jgi:beta-lactamase superfamily II metal-dependent hydrolase